MRRFTDSKLVVATHNQGKRDEIASLLTPFAIELLSAKDFGLIEPEETETTFVGNARIKAHFAAKETGLPALADDSGIEIDALDGAPGVYTADWAETPDGRDFKLAMRKSWEAIQNTGENSPFGAAFCCTLVLAWPDGHDEVFEGKLHGQVVWPMRGAEGHGYDPIFQPNGYDVTLGELSFDEKNRISHRARAFETLIRDCFA